MNFIGRGPNSGPATDFFPLSAATASSPMIAITGTTAAAQTPVHTGDAAAQDVLYITVANVSANPLVAYGQLGSTATTNGSVQLLLPAGQYGLLFNGNASISKSGIVGIWTTASTGLNAYGFVQRTYTATS